MISTRGRYGIRVLVDLAEQGGEDRRFVALRDVAERQGISEKYLQHVVKLLVERGLLVGVSGKGGGYRLARDPRECSVLEVLEAAEGTTAPVACLAEGAAPCERAPVCKTLPLWRGFDALTRRYFGAVTIADLAEGTADPAAVARSLTELAAGLPYSPKSER